MTIEYSPDVNTLYLTLRSGPVTETVEIDEMVYVDLDADDQPVGVEFVHADQFLPFLQRHAGILNVPDDIGELARSAAASS